MPDLHATTAAIDGLVASGLPVTDPHLLAAQRFVLACQEGGHGGARYSPDDRLARGDHDASGGAGVASKAEAYGSMTHAYLADLIVLGLDRDDMIPIGFSLDRADLVTGSASRSAGWPGPGRPFRRFRAPDPPEPSVRPGRI